MALTMRIVLFGDVAFRHEIERVGRRAMNMSPILGRIAEDWRDRIEQQFATEGKRSGRPWAPLQFATIKHRGSAHPILVESADLLIQATDEDLWRVTDDGISIEMEGAVEEYGTYHQSGTRRMPSRPIIDFTEIDERRDVDSLSDYLRWGRLHR